MILLRLFDDGNNYEAQFLDLSEMKNDPVPDNYYKNIELIEKEDIKDILIYLFDHEDAVIEQYDESLLRNPVQQLIYKDLSTELLSVQQNKKTIIDKVNEEFEEAENKYKDEE